MGLNFTLTDDQIPGPGEDVLVDLGGGLQALIANTAELDGAPEPMEGLVTYTVVDVYGAARTHAAEVTQRAQRTRVSRWTLCSRNESRRVSRRRRDLDLAAVSCTQCRKRLEAEGLL